jgi:RNA polymerase sigma factor (TIGR02999 family)
MNEVTFFLNAIEAGDPLAAEKLLPLVYDELRRLAASKMAREKPGQTLGATALVHEAYLRLVGEQKFEHRAHFFAAAAEAMRRILVERARQKQTAKRGGGLVRSDASPDELAGASSDPLELLAVHEALDRLAAKSPRKAELVKLRYFLGCTIPEASELLGIAPATAEEDWTFARAWLRRHLGGGAQES